MSFIGFLGLLLIGLKLAGYIQWSWWWVLAPWWGSAAFTLVSFASLLSVATALQGRRSRFRARRGRL